MSRISRTREARQDYLDIYKFIAPDNAPAAERLLRRFDETLATVARVPSLCDPGTTCHRA